MESDIAEVSLFAKDIESLSGIIEFLLFLVLCRTYICVDNYNFQAVVSYDYE